MRPNRKKEKKSRTKQLKYSPLLLGLIVAVAVITGAAILTYYVQMSTSVTIEPMLTWDDEDAEEYDCIETIVDAVGGNTYTFDHWLNLSGHADSNRTVLFTWSGNDTDDGITPSIWYDGAEVTDLELIPGGSYQMTTKYVLDDHASSGSYSCILTID